MSMINFLFMFLIILCILFIIAPKLVVWILSRIMKASVKYKISGWTCLKDVIIRFEKGAVKSVSVGEIRFRRGQSLAKLQLLISTIKIVTRDSNEFTTNTMSQKSRQSGSSGKWMVVANMARFLSISVTKLDVKTQKALVEVGQFRIEISKDGFTRHSISVTSQLLPVFVHLAGSSGYNNDIIFSTTENRFAPFVCQEFDLSCEFGHDREAGIEIKTVYISMGKIALNLNEELITRMKSFDTQVAKNNRNKEAPLLAIPDYTSFIPEKFWLTLEKLNVTFVHKEPSVFMENNIIHIQLKSEKGRSNEYIEESTRLDLQLEFSELNLLKYAEDSMVDISKLSVTSSVYIPLKHTSPIRSQIDVKLGFTKCNLFMERLKSLMTLISSNKKKMVVRNVNINPVTVQSSSKVILWSCEVAAPDMTVLIFNLSGFPIYYLDCSEPLHVFANNISSKGTSVHLELEELNLHMADEYQESSLLHVQKFSLDWGENDNQSSQDDSLKFILVLSVDITSMDVNLTFKRLQSLISTAFLFKTLLRTSSPSFKAQTWVGRSTKPPGNRIQLLQFNLKHCFVKLVSDIGLENEVIEDPALVNYGSQGGRVLCPVLADKTSRTAKIQTTLSNEHGRVKCIIALDIYHFSLCLNKNKQSIQLDLEQATSAYQEYLEDKIPDPKVTLFDIKNAKLVIQPEGLREISVCSLFSATDITLRWEPDVHLALLDLGLRMKLLYDFQKDKCICTDKEEFIESLQSDTKYLFAIDLKMITVTAEAGDGVEAEIKIQSIFSENACMGVLLKGMMLKFNGSRVFKSDRMKISWIPNVKRESDGKWDWVIEASDIHMCMPYRLQLLALDESIQEMLRALNLVTASKTKLLFPFKESGAKPKVLGSSKIGCVTFCIRKLTADIEEEPMQGWLDEHYLLIKNEARELAVRLDFLDSVTAKLTQSPAVVEKLKEEIYKKSFHSYYRACQNLVAAEGSGPIRNEFQTGFKLSTSRTSLFSIIAEELNIRVSAVEGGEAGMIDFVQNLDPVARENKVPFSCLYGCNLKLDTGSLDVQLRDYTSLLSGTSGKCEGRLVLAQQATPFQPQVLHDVYIGRWRKVQMYRAISGTTPPMKTYWDLPLFFQKGEISYGVGFEPAFADVSYAFTVALRRANLCARNPNASKTNNEPPKKEESLPWWDEMRNSIHGKTKLCFTESTFNILASIDPYEKSDKLQITSGYTEFGHSDGSIYISAKDFKMFRSGTIKPPVHMRYAFLLAPNFNLKVNMDWECDSGNPLNHFLFPPPSEGMTREKIYDSFRSTSLSLRWNFSISPIPSYLHDPCTSENYSTSSTTLNVGPHDFEWIIKFLNLNYIPPHKLRYFSQCPRFGVRRVRTSKLSLGEVLTESMFHFDSTPTVLRHISLDDDDPAKGLTFMMEKMRFEMWYSRGKQKYTFESKRDTLNLIYLGLDLHMPKIFLYKDDGPSLIKAVQGIKKNSKSASERRHDDGFLLSSDYFSIRRQSPKADPARLLAWQKACRKNLDMTYVRSEFEDGSESDEQARSEDGYNVVIAENCSCVFVYGLKLLWTIENRNAVWSWVGEFSKAYTPSKPSLSRQYAQRKLLEGTQVQNKTDSLQEDVSKNPSIAQGASSSKQKEASGSNSPEVESLSFGAFDKHGVHDFDKEGTHRFMVKVIEPQFNLHSEDANGRFLLAAATGRVLARSFHSVLNVGIEMIKQELGSRDMKISEFSRNHMEFSVMLEHVQAHVALTDTDPGAGLQWLPKIPRNPSKVKRTGTLLEQVFKPCDMYFRYTLHKGGETDLKIKPLKELEFNSQNITATMTTRQFQVMLDVLTKLLFSRIPKPRIRKLSNFSEYSEEEEDELVPDAVEEVELEPVNLEQKERALNLLFDDIQKLSALTNTPEHAYSEKEGNLWMITCGRSTLVHNARKQLVSAQKSRMMAAASLRMAMQRNAQLQLMEKENNKSPSCAMRVSLKIKKVDWGMLVDGKPFAKAEIHDMIFDFGRDFKDVGRVKFSAKYFVLRNCLPNAKSDMLLSPWNPPSEWQKKVMLQVDAKLGAPKDGNSPIELFEVDIYPLKIHLTEKMYRMMWDYFFPEEEQDSQQRQEVWKVSTTAGVRRQKKGSTVNEAASSSHLRKELKGSSGSNPSAESIHESNGQNGKTTTPDLGRTLSLERIYKESVANELMLQRESSAFAPLKVNYVGNVKPQDESGKTKSNTTKSGRSSQEGKKLGKPNDDKSFKELRKIHNIKISQVELLVTYKGSTFSVKDLRLLMDMFHCVEFTGSWQRLFSRVKKHILWGFLKSVTGLQGKKFKDKLYGKGKETAVYGKITAADLNLSDSDGDLTDNRMDRVPVTWTKRPPEGAGDGFVSSVRGVFHSQRRKAKPFVLLPMIGEEENDQLVDDDSSESYPEDSVRRQLSITNAKKHHAEKFRAKRDIPLQHSDSSSSLSPIRETTVSESKSYPYKDFLEHLASPEESTP